MQVAVADHVVAKAHRSSSLSPVGAAHWHAVAPDRTLAATSVTDGTTSWRTAIRVGVIGLGNIGGHIANNLVTDGHEVTVYDVDAARVAAIEGAEAAANGGGGRQGG